MKMFSAAMAAIAASLAQTGLHSKALVATVNTDLHKTSAIRNGYSVFVETREGVREVWRPKSELGKKLYRVNGDVAVMTRKGFHLVRTGHSKHHRSMVSA